MLTDRDADDGSQVGPLLDQVDGSVAAFIGDGAYDRDDVYVAVAARHPGATVVVLPRASAVPSAAAEAAPTQRDAPRWKRVISDGLRSQTDGRQATEVTIVANVLNRMLDLGCPNYVRIA